MLDKIAIVGKSNTKDQAPYNDLNWDIWMINLEDDFNKRFTKAFEIHNLNKIKNSSWLKAVQKNPEKFLICGEHKDKFPDAIAFPKQLMIEHFKSFTDKMHFDIKDVFTSSVAWAMAYAIFLNPEKIGVWGVDMAVGTEYLEQLPALMFWFGIAHKSGIEIILPPECKLFERQKMYWNL